MSAGSLIVFWAAAQGSTEQDIFATNPAGSPGETEWLWRSLEHLEKPSTWCDFLWFSLSSWETMGNWDQHRFVVSIIEVFLKYYWSHPWVDGQWQSYFAYLQSGFFRWQSWRRKRCATRSWMRQGFSMIFSSRSSYSMLLVNVQLVCKGCVYFCVFTPTSGSLFCHAPCGSYGSCGSCNEHKKNTKHYVHSLQYLQYDMFWHVLTMVGICFLDNMQTKNQEI